jgi:hypothetical protein
MSENPPPNADTPALRPDGTLKEASEIVWFNSPSDEHPIGFVANQEVNISLSLAFVMSNTFSYHRNYRLPLPLSLI